ncbi:MAG TPA: hypothetical protein VES62_12880 [Thermoleophilaceae bacterium]|nr:hypothetical protein [Thermoleophilaceae bacterium]
MGTRTSGSEGGGEQTTTRKRGTAARLRPYFSIVQRKALTPNDFGSLEELAERLLAFGRRYREIARPFEWTFTRADLERVLERVDARERPALRLVA